MCVVSFRRSTTTTITGHNLIGWLACWGSTTMYSGQWTVDIVHLQCTLYTVHEDWGRRQTLPMQQQQQHIHRMYVVGVEQQLSQPFCCANDCTAAFRLELYDFIVLRSWDGGVLLSLSQSKSATRTKRTKANTTPRHLRRCQFDALVFGPTCRSVHCE